MYSWSFIASVPYDNVVVLNILLCGIVPGFCRSGHNVGFKNCRGAFVTIFLKLSYFIIESDF